MSTQPPKRSPRKHQSKKIVTTTRAQWENILRTIPKDEVPLDLVESLVIRLIDGTNVVIDVDELRKDGLRSSEIETVVHDRIHELNDLLMDIDFFISIDSVAGSIQPITDDLLKGM